MKKLGRFVEQRINMAAKLSMEMQYRVIFHRITEAYNSGKSPLVVYDGSHVVTLTPAINLFTKTS